MPELTKVDPVKTVGFVKTTSGYENRRQQRKKEEDELEQAIKDLEGKEDGTAEDTSEKVSETETDKQKEVEPVSAEERTFKKRYGDLRRHSQSLQEKIKELEEKSKNSPVSAPTNEEDIATWIEKNPNVAGIVEAIAERKANEKFESTNQKFEAFENEKHEMSVSKAETAITKAHGDFADLRESDEFHDWAEKQPEWVQKSIYENENDAGGMIRAIDLYKMDKGLTPSAKKEDAKKAASSVKSKTTVDVDAEGTSKKISESDVEKMTDAQFEKALPKIEEAQRTGNFVYDMTGGAR